MKRIIVTGFGRFPGAASNPSQDLVAALGRMRRPALDDVEIVTAVLPVTWAGGLPILRALIADHRPDAVVMFGLAGRSRTLRIETRAVNLGHGLRPDASRRVHSGTLEPGGPIARLWSTALSGLVNTNHIKATGHSVVINLPKTATKGEVTFEWKTPQWSNALERNRARTYFQAYACALGYDFIEKALAEVRAGHTKTWEKFTVPTDAVSCGFTEAVRGVLSHHMVIRDGKIANYHPYPPTPWNANPRDSFGTPGPYEDAVQGQPIFEENDREHFKGIDIMRTVRSFDPCLPCGVHMYLGGGKKLELLHSPTQSAGAE